MNKNYFFINFANYCDYYTVLNTYMGALDISSTWIYITYIAAVFNISWKNQANAIFIKKHKLNLSIKVEMKIIRTFLPAVFSFYLFENYKWDSLLRCARVLWILTCLIDSNPTYFKIGFIISPNILNPILIWNWF